MKQKTLDVICMGRACADLYGLQIGSRLEDMSSFAKYLGGSSCNMAFGTARLGLKSAMLTRVGNDHMGRFIRETLANEGVDVSHVKEDPERLTAMVVLGIKDQETFPLIFVRENCADMAISKDDFDAEFIGSSKSLVITGTHFSTAQTNEVCRLAIQYAQEAGTKTVLDIDYRPVLWGLTSKGDGENRFIANEEVSSHMQSILPLFDLIVGTEEEINIAGGCHTTIESLRVIRSLTDAEIVVKRGPLGCSIFDGEIPESLDDGFTFGGVRVEVLNVLGAGDAFISGFLFGWIRGESYETSCAYANACGALVVSRHGCSPAMPNPAEMEHYLANVNTIRRPDLDDTLNYLHRVACKEKEWEELNIFAFDHRRQLVEMAEAVGAPLNRIPKLKSLLVNAVQRAIKIDLLEGKVGVLIDDTFGQNALNEVTGQNWWIARPVELPGSRPLQFEKGDNVGLHLQNWPKEHIVKCLVFYHPDDDSVLKAAQEKKIQQIYEACVMTEHKLLLEVIPPKGSPVEDDTMSRAITNVYDLGVFPDWWKLPSQSRGSWQKIDTIIKERAPYCKGIVLLGLDAPAEELKAGFQDSTASDLVKGFAVGRTIFGKPSRAWLADDLDDAAFIDAVYENYRNLIQSWRDRHSY